MGQRLKAYAKTYGSKGELLAAHYLKQKGYEIIDTHWHCHWGEIDIVCKKNNKLHFFEVKTRQHNVVESVHFSKKKHLLRSVLFYIKRYGHSYDNFQIDFVGVETGHSEPKIIHHEHMIEASI